MISAIVILVVSCLRHEVLSVPLTLQDHEAVNLFFLVLGVDILLRPRQEHKDTHPEKPHKRHRVVDGAPNDESHQHVVEV